MPTRYSSLRLVVAILSLPSLLLAADSVPPPAKGIQDNSFFIEEAYNQEAGVVQHIFNASFLATDHDDEDVDEYSFVFTQEWPLFSQTHQLSYTVPFSYIDDHGQDEEDLGDILLNYRWQALFESDTLPAVAPRFSLILPTGDEDEGLGNEHLGFQFNLPISKIIADRWTLHANAGLTFNPDEDDEDLLGYNLGASVIYAATPDLNFLLEAVANWDEEITDSSNTDHSASIILSPGLRYALNLPDDLQIVLGAALPIGLSHDAPDYGLFLYLSIEHPFAQ